MWIVLNSEFSTVIFISAVYGVAQSRTPLKRLSSSSSSSSTVPRLHPQLLFFSSLFILITNPTFTSFKTSPLLTLQDVISSVTLCLNSPPPGILQFCWVLTSVCLSSWCKTNHLEVSSWKWSPIFHTDGPLVLTTMPNLLEALWSAGVWRVQDGLTRVSDGWQADGAASWLFHVALQPPSGWLRLVYMVVTALQPQQENKPQCTSDFPASAGVALTKCHCPEWIS